MNRRIGLGVFAAAAVLVMALGSSAPSQDTVAVTSFAKLLPADCMLYMSVRDVATLRKNLDAAGLKEIMDSQEMKDFIDYLKKKADEQGAKNETPKALQDVKPEDILNSVEGEICFAVGKLDFQKLMDERKGGEKPAPPDEVYFLVNAKGKAEAFADLVKKGQQAAIDSGAKKSEETYKGVTISSWRSKEADKDEAAVCRSGSWFAMAPTVEGLKRLIARSQENKGDDLTTNKSFQTVTRAVGENADATFYLNTVEIVKAVKKAAKKAAEDQNPQAAGVIDPIIEGLGIEGIEAVGFGVTVGADRIQTKGFISTPKGQKGLIKAMFPQCQNPKIPAFVPEDAHSFSAMKFDVASGYETLMDVASAAMQAAGQQMDIEQMVEMMLGINLKDDIIDNLTGEAYSVAKFNRPFNEKSAEQTQVWMVKDSKKLTDAIQSVFDMIAQQAGGQVEVEEEEYLNVKVRSIGAVSFAIKDGHFITGTKDSVKACMRRLGGSEKTLADNALYKELARELPASYQSVGFGTPDGLEYLLTIVKSGDFFKLMGGGMKMPNGPDPEDLKKQAMENFDFSKIPSPQLFVKRLVGSIYHSTVTSEGVTMSFLLKLKKTG